MKKRILMCALAATMALTLSGCGRLVSQVAEGAKDQLQDVLEDVAEGAKDAIDQAEEGIEKLDDAVKDGLDSLENGNMLHPMIKHENISYNDSKKGSYYNIALASFVFDDSDQSRYKELVKAVTDRQDDINSSIKDGAKEMEKSAKEYANESLNEWGYYNSTYEDSYNLTPMRADDVVFSYISSGYSFYGGAHGSSFVIGYNYDTKTGELIKSNEIVKDADAVAKLIYDKLLEDNNEDAFFDVKNLEKDIAAMIKGDKLTFVITYNGIEVVFNQYEIAPYAAGVFDIWLYPEENPSYYEAKYLETPDNYMYEFTNAMVDVDGDGKREQVSLKDDYNFENSQYENYGVMVDGKSAVTDDYAFSLNGYLVKNGENYYVYIQGNVENDYVNTKVYDVTGGNPKQVGTEKWGLNLETACIDYYWDDDWNAKEYNSYNVISCLTDPMHMLFGSNTSYLSTFEGIREYYCGEDGIPVASDKYPDYVFLKEHVFTAGKLFNAVEVDEDGNFLGSIEVPKGTKLTYYRTDDSSYGDVKTDDGKIIRIVKEDNSDYWFCIDGKDGNEVLEGAVFAG